MGNTFKTALLLTALTIFLLFIGEYFAGQNGLILGLGIAVVMNFVSYFYSDKISLAMYRAQPVTREQLPRVYAVVERLTQKSACPCLRFMSFRAIPPMPSPPGAIPPM